MRSPINLRSRQTQNILENAVELPDKSIINLPKDFVFPSIDKISKSKSKNPAENPDPAHFKEIFDEFKSSVLASVKEMFNVLVKNFEERLDNLIQNRNMCSCQCNECGSKEPFDSEDRGEDSIITNSKKVKKKKKHSPVLKPRISNAEDKIEEHEMKNNRTSVVLRNIEYNHLVDNVLLKRIFDSVGFHYEDGCIQFTRSFIDKAGFKRLEIKFNSLKDKIRFANMFNNYGLLRNLDIGLATAEIINLKEKLTKRNNHFYFLANQMAKNRKIKDFQTCDGFVYVLPIDAPRREQFYCKITNLEILNLFRNL